MIWEGDIIEPIIEFKSQAELDASLKEWQERLFLADWIIKAKVEHAEVEGIDVVGYCEDAPTIKAAIISITPADEIPKDAIVKSCAEKPSSMNFYIADFCNLKIRQRPSKAPNMKMTNTL